MTRCELESVLDRQPMCEIQGGNGVGLTRETPCLTASKQNLRRSHIFSKS